MNEPTQAEMPRVGIFWVAQTADGKARLLAAGCPLDQAEPYGDCLTYSPGHYNTWERWRRDKTVDPAQRVLARSYEYEDWPRGRITFDRGRDRFILYTDRKSPDAGNDRANPSTISLAGGTHRDSKRRALSEHRDAESANAVTLTQDSHALPRSDALSSGDQKSSPKSLNLLNESVH